MYRRDQRRQGARPLSWRRRYRRPSAHAAAARENKKRCSQKNIFLYIHAALLKSRQPPLISSACQELCFAARSAYVRAELHTQTNFADEERTMSLTARNPFALLNELQRDLNRAFDSRLFPALTGNSNNALSNTTWSPAVDIHEDQNAYHISVDLPGVKPEEIEVTAHNNVLSIRGARKVVNEDKEQKRSERIYGAFLREFSMPENADLDRIEAKCNNGVLDLMVPKIPKSEPKRITVQ